MDRILSKLERRLGGIAIDNLTLFISGGMAVVLVLGLLKPAFLGALTLDLARVRQGEAWRLVTYLFLPGGSSPIWSILAIYWFWVVGSAIETEWGSFKFNAYYLVGMIGTTAAAWIAGGAAGNLYLNLSLFLAFATLFPSFELFLFFVVRVQVKWLGFLTAAFLLYSVVEGSWVTRAAILASFSNYLLFFGGTLVETLRGRRVMLRQAARRVSTPPGDFERTVGGASGGQPFEKGGMTGMGERVCAICGASEVDGADIRVCSCAKCGGVPRNLCLEHARNH